MMMHSMINNRKKRTKRTGEKVYGKEVDDESEPSLTVNC